MSIFSQEVRREFIARPDTAKGQLLFKWPDTNIRKLTQLTVEQDELAVFFRDGRVQGTIQPGRVTLDSSEIPFLGILVDAASGGNLFRTELYFISTREFPNLPFGGAVDNVMDPQTNLGVGLRVFGEYSLKVIEPQSLIVNLVGTQNLSTNDEDKLRSFRHDAQDTKLAGGCQQYAAGQAMIGAGQGLAQGPGQGGGVNPAFLGVGLGMGGLVAGQMGQTLAAGGQIQVRCANCHALNAENAKFCSSCGQALSPAPAPTGATMACPKCGTQNAATAKFCTNCGQTLTGGGTPAPAS